MGLGAEGQVMQGDGADDTSFVSGRGRMALWALLTATALVACVAWADLATAGEGVISPVSPTLAGALFACVTLVAVARWLARRGRLMLARALTLVSATLTALTALAMLLIPIAIILALPLALFACSDTWPTCSPRIGALLLGALASGVGALALLAATVGLIRTHYRRDRTL